VTEVLQNDKYAKIAIPTNAVIEWYKQLIKAKYPALDNVWALMDGQVYNQTVGICCVDSAF
jgi:hypothetical protein